VLSWLIAFHVLVAGLLMYAYARWSGLGRAGAIVAAVGYMFAGKWLLHLLGAGHYITIGLAWLPLAVLCLEHAVRRGSVLSATWAGLVFGLMALGTQPQWTFYSGLFLGAWTLGIALEQPGGLRFALRAVLFGAWVAILAVGLARATVPNGRAGLELDAFRRCGLRRSDLRRHSLHPVLRRALAHRRAV
jgi:hypothetical protein